MSNPAAAPVRTVRAEGEQFAHSRQLEWLARAGLVARGVIYAIIGVLAIKLALGDGGKATNQQGALKTIAHQPFGKALLVVVAIGLAGYAIWRLVRAAIGHGPESRDSGKERLAGLASGIAYGLLCVTAVKILSGSGTGSGGPQKATGGVLDWPGGTWLVGIAGVVMLVVAAEQAYKGVTKEFLEKSKTEEMSREVRARVHRARRLRPRRPRGRLRAHRLRPHPGGDRLRPRQGDRPRRRAGEARPGVLRPGAARRRGRRAARLRRVLDRRRALPEGLTARGASAARRDGVGLGAAARGRRVGRDFDVAGARDVLPGGARADEGGDRGLDDRRGTSAGGRRTAAAAAPTAGRSGSRSSRKANAATTSWTRLKREPEARAPDAGR